MVLLFGRNVVKLLVLAVLLSAIACNELPELIQLVDNPTNDFTAPSSFRAVAVAAPLRAMPTGRASFVPSYRKPSGVPPETVSRAPRDLLLLQSLLRT